MMNKIASLVFCLSVALAPAWSQVKDVSQKDPAATLPDGLYAVLSTGRGTIVLELFMDRAPVAVTSFVGLAEGTLAPSGKPYFDGVTFHRVEPGFVIQGGDPTGTGRGGPGYQFPNEIVPGLGFDGAGVVGMANAGPDTNGSQFFITLGPATFLDGSYTVFGRVASGMDVVRAIRKGDVMKTVRITRKGPVAAAFLADQASFDAAVRRSRLSGAEKARIAVAGQLDRVRNRLPSLVEGNDGLLFTVTRNGNGPVPDRGSEVKVLYSLTLADGTLIDASSMHDNGPLVFKLGEGRVIAGFERAVASMRQGEKRTVVIPPELGYGSAGAGGKIPPYAVLVFELDLLRR